MASRWFLIACFIGLPGAALLSQAQNVTPLHTFFQHNYDSTIVYQSGLSAKDGPYYLLLAKQKNQVYFFTYRSPYRETAGRYFPGNLVRHFAKQEAAFRAAVPGTNRYLLPSTLAPDTLLRYWRQLNPRRFWTVKGDPQAPPAAAAPPCMIDDGDYNTFYLMNSRAIRVAAFYAPAYWETCLGPDSNRQQAIKAQNTFSALLRASQQTAR